MFCDPSSHIPAEYIEVHELIGVNASEIGRDALLMVIKNSPSDDEIWDRSKADTFSKLIVALQTSWFLAQIVSRRIQNLAITEIEIITLAYAAFNGAMYAFWWTKPLDVQSPIVIPFTNIHALRQHYALRQQYAHLQRPYAPRQPGGMPTEVETRSTMVFRVGDLDNSAPEPFTLTSIQPSYQSALRHTDLWTGADVSRLNRVSMPRRSSSNTQPSTKFKFLVGTVLRRTMHCKLQTYLHANTFFLLTSHLFSRSSQALGHYAPRLCPHRIPTA